MHQQRWGEPTDHDSQCSAFNRSSSARQGQPITTRTLLAQEKGKAPMQQVFVPKKGEETPIAPTQKSNPLASITIGSVEVPITNNDGPIIIEDLAPATTQDGSTSVTANVYKNGCTERDTKYLQRKW